MLSPKNNIRLCIWTKQHKQYKIQYQNANNLNILKRTCPSADHWPGPRMVPQADNPLPIQIPSTYSHSRHPTCTRPEALEFKAQIIGIIPQAGPLPKESSPNSNPSHLQPLPPPYRGPCVLGDRDQTKPYFANFYPSASVWPWPTSIASC